MGKIFGGGGKVNSSMYLPLGSCEWSIKGVISNQDAKNTALLALTLDDNEAVDIRRCFNDITHIFAFGRDFKTSYINVTLICFLGKKCGKDGSTGFEEIQKLRETYNEKRIYKTPESMEIKVEALHTKGFLVGMAIGNFDPVHETCTITFTFIPDEEV